MGQQRRTRSRRRVREVTRNLAQRWAAARRPRVARLVLPAVGLGLGIAAALIGISWLLVRDPGWAYHTWPQLTPAERTTATTQFRTTVVQLAAAAGAPGRLGLHRPHLPADPPRPGHRTLQQSPGTPRLP